MILLYDGMSMQTLVIILGGIFVFLGFVAILHFLAMRTRFYKNEFINFNSVRKMLYYIFFLIGSCFISWAALYVLMVVAANMMSYFR